MAVTGGVRRHEYIFGGFSLFVMKSMPSRAKVLTPSVGICAYVAIGVGFACFASHDVVLLRYGWETVVPQTAFYLTRMLYGKSLTEYS